MQWCLLIGICLLACSANVGRAATNDAAQTTERNLFAADIFTAIAPEKLTENVVISPAAIQTSMALAYAGAKGRTADEIRAGLRLGSSNADDVVRHFGNFQQTFTRGINNIKMFTKFYINENLEFKGKFRDVAQRDFNADIEKVDFHPPYNRRTAEMINTAMARKTDDKILNIIKPEILNDRTEGVMVNGIAFTAAPWQMAFKADKTKMRSFSTGRQSFDVETMWTLNNFKYGEFANLDAKAIELPYQNQEFAMIILLPNQKDGLANLVRSLANKDVVQLLSNGWNTEKLEVYLPKFSAAFGVSLEQPFKKLGVSRMFTREGDFGDLYRMFVSHYLNAVEHKAYVAVSEAGAEPAMDSGVLKSLFSRNKKFEVDHPFVFAIRHHDSVILMGHIASYAYV